MTILVIATVAYVLEFLFLRMGLDRSDRLKKNPGYAPSVSIIVAARNEEQYIESCLNSLTQLEYPREKLEIIVVNDRSTDRTSEIIEPFAERYPFIKMFSTRQEEGNLRGKTNAVAHGISVSSGEILMFTDADCTVPRKWVQETVQYFDEKTGVVGGFTVLNANRMFEGIQNLDWIFLFGLASATAGWKIPLTVIGNNLSVRRSAYDATGGYEKIPFSVTEDYSLVQSILKHTGLEVRFPLNPETVVLSSACRTWKQLYRQKQRWGVGGLDMVLRGIIIMSIGWLVKLALIIGIFSVSLPVWFTALACKLFMDVRFLWKPLKRFGSASPLKYFLFFELYFTVYVLIIPFIAMFSKKIVWKERSL